MGDGGWNLSWKNDKVLILNGIIFQKLGFFPPFWGCAAARPRQSPPGAAAVR
jgi:hypothetical protein